MSRPVLDIVKNMFIDALEEGPLRPETWARDRAEKVAALLNYSPQCHNFLDESCCILEEGHDGAHQCFVDDLVITWKRKNE